MKLPIILLLLILPFSWACQDPVGCEDPEMDRGVHPLSIALASQGSLNNWEVLPASEEDSIVIIRLGDMSDTLLTQVGGVYVSPDNNGVTLREELRTTLYEERATFEDSDNNLLEFPVTIAYAIKVKGFEVDTFRVSYILQATKGDCDYDIYPSAFFYGGKFRYVNDQDVNSVFYQPNSAP